MKIAITSMYLPSGSKIGVGYQVHYLANALQRRGHEVTVFSQTGPSDGSLYETVAVPCGRRMRTVQFCWNLRKIDFMRFDALNAHGDDWFLWGQRLPQHVHTYHGSCFAEALHSRRMIGRVRMGALALCEFSSTYLADELVAVSANTCRYIPQVNKVIHCGTDLNRFHPTDDKADKPTLLFVGTMHGRKRGRWLVEQFNQHVRPRVPDAELWAVCEEPVEAPGVRWFGRIPLDQLCDLFRRAWVFCLPSTYEGFGVPYVEAMASGTPAVASPNVGAREVLEEGRSGVVADDGELALRLVELLSDRALRERYTDAGLKRSKDFGWDRVCGQYERLYRGESTPQQMVVAS